MHTQKRKSNEQKSICIRFQIAGAEASLKMAPWPTQPWLPNRNHLRPLSPVRMWTTHQNHRLDRSASRGAERINPVERRLPASIASPSPLQGPAKMLDILKVV